jgi:hypothetical protein
MFLGVAIEFLIFFGVSQGSNFIAAIAVGGEQNAVDHCSNNSNFFAV